MTTYAPHRPGMHRLPVDPRIRARRVAVMREQGRRRLRRLLAVLGVVGTAGLATGAVLSPLLDVDEVAVHGVGGPHADEVRAVLRRELKEPLLLVDTGAAATRVEALPWVDHARVDRELPGTLRVDVTPRFAVGWRNDAAGRVLLVDGLGGVVTVASAPPPGLPKLESDGGEARAAARVAAALTPTLRSQVGIVTVTAGQATLRLLSGAEARYREVRDLGAKARAVEALLRALGATPFTYLDVGVPSAPVRG